jgi:predicted nucleic acid-binding protein
LIHYFDTSALAKRYMEEPGSRTIRSVLRRGYAAVVRITYAELLAAVARACHLGAITAKHRSAFFARIEEDFGDLTIVEVRPPVLRRVPELVTRYPLRGYDAVQLAAALTIQDRGGSVRFWSADAQLVEAAEAEGLRAMVPSE